MTKNTTIAFVFLFLMMIIGLISVYWVLDHKLHQQVAYVDVPKLYEDFDMTQQLNNRYADVTSKRQYVADSLNLELTQLQSSVVALKGVRERDQVARQMQEIIHQRDQIQQSNAQMKADFESQIWMQLNTYIQDFGDQHDYTMISGATGNGSLLYAQKKIDATQDIINYVNIKFNHN